MIRAFVTSLILLLGSVASAEDRLRIQIQGSGAREYQLAVQRFDAAPGAENLPEEFYRDLTHALQFSSVFQIVDPGAFLEPKQTRDFDSVLVPCDNWRAIGSDALVQGRLERQGEKLRARFRVWDLLRCRSQGKPMYFEDDLDMRGILARRVADEIVYRFTGERGVSSTQIAFVSDKTGNKEIYLMEADGSSPRRVTGNGSVNLFPSWSPNGSTLVYTSLRGGRFDLWTIARGPRTGSRVMKEPHHKYRGVWAPNDGQIAITMHQKGNTDVYTVGHNGKRLRRVTTSRFIESSPSWSPDGKKLAFVSDRSGSPQIYLKDLRSDRESRLTFRGGYNASPAWSPRGDWIVYSAQTGSSFDLYLIDPDTGYTTPLVVHPRSDEDPAWSPDGRKIIFSSSRRGRKELYRIDLDGRNLVRLLGNYGNSTNPAWSPWLD